MIRSLVKLTIVRALYVLFLLCVVLLLFLKPSAVAIFVVLGAVVVLLPVVTWHARISSFMCPHCGAKSNITALISFLSPHIPGQKWLYCPSCNVAAWCQRVPR